MTRRSLLKTVLTVEAVTQPVHDDLQEAWKVDFEHRGVQGADRLRMAELLARGVAAVYFGPRVLAEGLQ